MGDRGPPSMKARTTEEIIVISNIFNSTTRCLCSVQEKRGIFQDYFLIDLVQFAIKSRSRLH